MPLSVFMGNNATQYVVQYPLLHVLKTRQIFCNYNIIVLSSWQLIVYNNGNKQNTQTLV